MHPQIRRNLPVLGQLDHVDRRRISAASAGPAFERCLPLPNGRMSRAPDCIERNAGFRLTPAALDLKPAETAIQALRYRWRRQRWSAVAFHAHRPRFCFGAIASRMNLSAHALDLAADALPRRIIENKAPFVIDA
jgi:hypothetical protein